MGPRLIMPLLSITSATRLSRVLKHCIEVASAGHVDDRRAQPAQNFEVAIALHSSSGSKPLSQVWHDQIAIGASRHVPEPHCSSVATVPVGSYGHAQLACDLAQQFGREVINPQA